MIDSASIGVTQTVAYDGTVAITNAFGAQTMQIRICANSACHYHIYEAAGTATASTADPYLPAQWIEVVTASPGQKISAIKGATNGLTTATAGTLWVTELS